jgi:hypothetical protein
MDRISLEVIMAKDGSSGKGKSATGTLLPPANPIKQMLAGKGFQVQ